MAVMLTCGIPSVYSGPRHSYARSQPAGSFHVRGWLTLDIVASHFTEDGHPLLPAAACAEIYGIKARTIYQWERRKFLAARGMDEAGRKLYDVAEVGMVKALPRRRKPSPPLLSAA